MKNSLDRDFDQQIREVMGRFLPPSDEATWEQLEEKLMAEGLTHEAPLDATIRESMAGMSVPYHADSWNALEQKIDGLQSEVFDKIDDKARALEHLQVPYEHHTWSILSEKLDQISYNRKLMALKVMEAAVIIFAIFTLVRILGNFPGEAHPSSKEFMVAESDGSSELSKQLSAPIETDVDADRSVTGSLETEEPDQQQAPTIAKVIAGDQPTYSTHDAQEVIQQEQEKIGISILKSSTPPIDDVFAQAEAHIRDRAQDVARIPTKNLNIKVPEKRLANYVVAAALPSVPTINLADTEAQPMFADACLQPIAVATAPTLTTKVGIYRAFNRHDVENFNSWTRSWLKQDFNTQAIGINAVVSYGRLGFDLGLGYDELTYTAEFTESAINKVHLPIHLRYTFLQKDIAQVYVKGGASYHAILTANYAEPTSTAPGPSTVPKSILPFPNGLLRGEYKESNTFWQLHAGIGAELTIFKRWSIYAECLYQDHHAGSLGNTQDKISTISTQIGLNYTL